MIRVANAPCSWGVLEFNLEGETAGYAQVLDEMREAGFAGTELGDWGFMPTDPETLRDELKARQLELVGAFVPVDLRDPSKHDEGIDVGVKTARLMSDAGFSNAFVVLSDNNGTDEVRTAIAGRVTPDAFMSDDEWRFAATCATKFARTVHDRTGLRTVFHHHCAGFVETPGEIEKMLSDTPDDVLGLVPDMGHFRFAGGYPLAVIRLFWDRIWHVHYKDCSRSVAAKSRAEKWDYFQSVRAGVFCELGSGEVDFQAITNELRTRGYDGWIVVEQDVLPGMGSPKETAARNREYLKSLGL